MVRVRGTVTVRVRVNDRRVKCRGRLVVITGAGHATSHQAGRTLPAAFCARESQLGMGLRIRSMEWGYGRDGMGHLESGIWNGAYAMRHMEWGYGRDSGYDRGYD